MKKIFILILISFSTFGQVRKSHDSKFDLLHTELHLTPIWGSQTLEGKALLTLVPYFYPQNELILNAKDFEIKRIYLESKNYDYSYDGRLITIKLDKAYTKNDTVKVNIDYVAQPEKIKEQLGEENKSEKGLYFINPKGETKGLPTQFWTQGETQSNSAWFPTIDFPNQNHTQDIYITLDQKYTTLSNGVLLSTKILEKGLKIDHWSQKLPHAVYLTMIAAGEFVKVVDKSFNRFEVSYYMEPEYAEYAQGIFGRTPEMIIYFESLFGVKFPWQKFAQVPIRRFISGAMENTTAVTHARSVLKTNHQLIDENDDAVIAHELIHHWFGNYVTTESWAQLPLNEAFANYSEYLWANHKYGKDEGDYTNFEDTQAYLGESLEKRKSLIRFNYKSSEDMFDAHSYQKGGRVLHTLRQEVGDEAFFKSLNYYLKQNAFQSVEIENLRLAFEKVTGLDLKWFFDQWFMGTGHPTVNVKSVLKDKKLELTINQLSDSLINQIFRVKLPIKILSTEGVIDTVIQLSSLSETFTFPIKGEFKNYIPNSDGHFLGLVIDDRTLENYIDQYNQSIEIYSKIAAFNIAISKTELENPLDSPKIREMVLKATQDKFWRIRLMAIQHLFDYDGEDFLKVEKHLENNIQNDPNSNVRAESLLAVKDFQNPFHIELARKAMTDTSYAVRAAALEILLGNLVPESDSLVNFYQNVNDSPIFSTVANYFVSKNTTGKTQWFVDRMQVMEGLDLYQYLGLLGSYLIVAEEPQFSIALPFLKEVAINGMNWYSRLGAVRVLYTIKDISDDARIIFEDALKNEKDKELIKYYEQYNVER